LRAPGGNITGITVAVGWGSEINGKRLQILKEAVPLASRVAVLAMRSGWEGADGQRFREGGQRLAISLIGMPLEESTASEYQRVFGEIAQQRPDAMIVSDVSQIFPYR
jgi:putative ABC transport system substrate-binding protein